MGFLQNLLHPKPDWRPEIDLDHGSLVCIKCEVTPPYLYEVDGILMCEECIEADQRRKQLRESEKEWKT